MTYNYFNSGRLAFGKKITAAFNSLYELLNAATEHVNTATDTLQYYTEFAGKNYPTPEPITGNMVSRTDEAFDILANSFYIKRFDTDGTIANFEIVYFSKDYSRITCASGSTEKESGYAIVKLSTSLTDFNKTIRFSDTDDATTGEKLLFKFERSGSDIYIIDPSIVGELILGDVVNYKSLSLTKVGDNYYKATKKAECVMIRHGVSTFCDMYLNGKRILWARSLQHTNVGLILYLQKGDEVSGAGIESITRINYNTEKK